VRSLKRELLAELREAHESGSVVRPEDVLARWPADPATDPDVASVLFEDFRQRQHNGEEPSVADYEERFPAQANSLAGLLHQNDLLHSVGGISGSEGTILGLPAVGDELFGFRLRHELGRGAFARVFLAEQSHLADRPVVLKVSGIEGDEPQTLAQLQHTHIVPIYSVHEDTRAGLRAVCMPYFGGASLSEVLHGAWADTEPPTQGTQLVQALSAVASPSIVGGQLSSSRGQRSGVRGQKSEVRSEESADRNGQAAAGLPTTADPGLLTPSPCALPAALSESYLRAVAWVVARLAEALEHAHQRGVLHRDIKPSNILLSAEGQPMLLDFNLAQCTNSPRARASATLGGTVAYMAPEHLRALASRDPALADQVDHRADIYSLGMVLFEMLTGRRPFEQSASYAPMPALIEAMAVERGKRMPSLRAKRRDVPWSLESVVRRCLAPHAAQRYQRAEHLAEDLQCFLEDRPLKHAPELSRVERVQKWMRRHPRLKSSGMVAAAASLFVVTLGAALIGANRNLANTQAHLDSAQDRERQQAYEAGTTRTLCLLNTVSDLDEHLRQGLVVCETTLNRYQVLEREDWQNEPAWQRLAPQDQQRLAEDTRELLLLLAWGQVRIAPHDPAVLREALILLDRAADIRGLPSSRALWEARAFYRDQLGETAEAQRARGQAEQLQPVSARDHYQLALSYARRPDGSGLALAVAELDRAIELNPTYYWSHMQRGLCHQQRGAYALAAADFGVCAGLWPEFAWGQFNLGCALEQLGRKEEAIRCYGAALERDPTLVLAFINRGVAALELQRYGPALEDLTKAAELGRDDAFLHAGRGMALEGLGRFPEAEQAFREAFRRAADVPDEQRSRLLWVYGFSVSGRLPGEARRAFDQVLRRQPDHPQALYGRALLAMREAEVLHALPIGNRGLLQWLRRQEALRFFDRAVLADPGLVPARLYRAILRARLGHLETALEDINWCLAKQDQDGATLYAAACVTALAAEQAGLSPAGALAAEQSIELLRRAFTQGYGGDKAALDPDLAGLSAYPRFQELLSQHTPIRSASASTSYAQ
jgi:serine/threonine protein kinase/tetratricopeptide (TPR) repeat protein